MIARCKPATDETPHRFDDRDGAAIELRWSARARRDATAVRMQLASALGHPGRTSS
jgi:hypothetical protein